MSSYRDDFNAVSDDIGLEKLSSVRLMQHIRAGYCDVRLVYDFAHRLLLTTTSGKSDHASVTPFSQLDSDVLSAMRDTLIKLGGSPPALAQDSHKPSLISKNQP